MGASTSDKRWTCSKRERKLSAKLRRNRQRGHRDWSNQYTEKEDDQCLVEA